MGFYSYIEGPVRGVIDKIISDPDLKRALTYRKFIGQRFDEDTLVNVDSFEEIPIDGVPFRHNKESVQQATAEVEIGDRAYFFRFTDLPEGHSLKDRILDENGYTLRVKAIQPIFDLSVIVTVEGP